MVGAVQHSAQSFFDNGAQWPRGKSCITLGLQEQFVVYVDRGFHVAILPIFNYMGNPYLNCSITGGRGLELGHLPGSSWDT